MRIIFLSRSYYPNVGGVEKHIYEVSKCLVAKGCKVTIVTEASRGKADLKAHQIKNVEVIRIPAGKDDWFKKFRIWKWIWTHKEIFFRADVIHCHDVFFWYLPLALINPMKNVYTTFHGYESYPIKFKAIIYRKVFEIMSNRTICVGDFMRKWYHAKPTEVIYGGVEIPKKISKFKKNTAIFIGRLDEQTGIETYVEAVRIIRKKIPDFTLTVYGDGPFREKIKCPGVIIKGFDPDADKEISKFEFAFMSRYLAILEAMAAKRLVIAVYDNPVKEDYLKMTPYKKNIIVENEANKVASQVLHFAEEPEEAESKVNLSYQWVKLQTWENVVDTYQDLWESASN